MLRRPPTVLTLTSEDLKAYEDRRDALLANKQRTRQHHHQTPLAEHTSRSTSSSGYEDVSDSTLHHHRAHAESDDDDDVDVEEEEEGEEEEDSYYPRRYRTIENPDEDAGPEIFLNEADVPDLPSDPFTSSSSRGSSTLAGANNHHHIRNNNAGEDHVMTELTPEVLLAARLLELQGDSSVASFVHQPPVSRFGRRTAAAAVTPTAGGRGNGSTGAVATPEAPVRQTRSREERILGRGGRR